MNTPTTRETAELTRSPVDRRRWFRYSMRTLLVAMTLLCIWLGLVVSRAERQRQTVAMLRAQGATVVYEEPSGDEWPRLRAWFGKDYFDDVKVVFVQWPMADDQLLNRISSLSALIQLGVNGDEITDEGLRSLERLDHLVSLSICSKRVTDDGLRSLAGLSDLELLLLRLPKATDRGIAHLAQLESLEYLFLHEVRISDQSLAVFAKLQNLRTLSIKDTNFRFAEPAQVSAQGLRKLAQLPNLNALHVSCHGITDEALLDLAGLPSLRRLGVSCAMPAYTHQGIAALHERMPTVAIEYSRWWPAKGEVGSKSVRFNADPMRGSTSLTSKR